MEFYLTSKKGIKIEFEKNNLKGLKLANKDVNKCLKEIPYVDFLELKSIIKLELGEDINELEAIENKAIEGILKRGCIQNDEEYRLLIDKADEFSSHSSKEIKLKKINDLLIDYHSK